MSIAQKIAKNTFWLYGSDILGKVLQIILVILLARYYGAETFGKYSFAVTFTFLFAMFVDSGMNGLIIREVAKNKRLVSKYVINVSGIKLALCVLSFIMIFIFINVLGYSEETKFLVYTFGLYNILYQLTEFLKTFFKAYEFMHLDSAVKLFEKIVTVSLSIGLIYLGYPLQFIAYSFVLSGIFTVVLAFFILRWKIPKAISHLSLDFSFMKKFIRLSLPFAAILILYTTYMRLDIIMIDKLIGNINTGVYNSAIQLVEALIFIPIFLGVAVFPLLSQTYKTKKRRFWGIFKKSYKILLIVSVPIVAATLVLSERFILIFFGNQYAGADMVLKILIVFMFFNFFTQFNNTIVYSMNGEIKLLKLLAAVTFLNLVLNYVLIQFYSIEGAAVTKVICEFVYVTGTLLIIRPQSDKKEFFMVLRTFFAGFLLFLTIKSFINLPIFWIVLLSILVYVGLVFVLRIISSEDLNLIKEVFVLKR